MTIIPDRRRLYYLTEQHYIKHALDHNQRPIGLYYLTEQHYIKLQFN